MPVSAAKRGQLNFELEPVEGMPLMENMPSMLYPWIWVEEGVNLPGMYIYLLHFTLLLYVGPG